ncbi:hypothetical protein [Acinetobacter guillouiae]|uniref:hypothetical protein n=1 Tax=Acinetobacter guillouiae TaxID=106649 RepID=UPI002FD9245F
MDINLKMLNNRIDQFKTNAEPRKLLMGYKTYSKLMKEEDFLNNLCKDPSNLLVSYYQGIEVKIVTEKHFFEIE